MKITGKVGTTQGISNGRLQRKNAFLLAEVLLLSFDFFFGGGGGWSSNFDFIEFSEQLHDNSVFFETCSKLEDGAKLQHASQRKHATKK